jgi:hypothetical protein
MAVLFSIADGNINATASWGVVEPTSFQATPNVTLTATPGLSSLYTGTSFVLASAVTVAGVALQLSGRVTTPTGTLNVQLFDVTGAAIIGQVTINIADLPNSQGVGSNHIDWVYFKFTSPVTTIAGRTYAIRLQMSVISQISWYYTGASTNPNRALVTTTSQAPVANDPLIIAGSYTSAGVNSTTTITMNYNSNNTIANGNIWVSSKGILTFATTFSTLLAISGYLVIGVGGTLIIGASLTPVQSNYLAALQMNCTTALQYPIWVYGTMTTYGAVKTPGVKLINDSLVGATSSTLSSTPNGWLVNDLLIFTSTSRNYTELELKYISSISGNIVNHTSQPNNYLHGGNATTKVQADVVNIYRNIYIQSIGDIFANKTNIQMFANSITSFYYTAFYSMGTGITVANSGICVNILNTGYTFEMQYCSIVQGNQASGYSSNTALFNQNTSGTTISNNIFYGLGWTSTVSTIISTKFDDGNYIIGCLATTQVLLATNTGSNNVFSSNNRPATTGFVNNASNNSFYSNNTIGLNIVNPSTTGNLNLTNFLIWRNNTFGIRFEISGAGYQRNNIISFTGLYCFGNTTASLTTVTRIFEKIFFTNSFFYGGTTLVQPTHYIASVIVDSIYYDNCYFGYSDSSLTSSPFSGAILQTPFPGIVKIFDSCYFNGTEISTTAGATTINMSGSYLSLNHNGVTASNRQWLSNGTITTDPTIFLSGVRSLRLSPSSASFKLTTPLVRVPVKIGTTCTISVNVRKSVTGDGSVYGGTTPRLMYAFNPVLGNLTETIAAIPINILQYAQDFNNGYWVKAASSITENSVTIAAPDGTFTADLFIEDNTTTRHRILLASTITVSIGTTYNLSLYAKKATHDWIQLNPVYDTFFGINNWANFNLSTGQIGNTGVGASASITSVGDDWYRLTLICDVIASGTTFLNLFVATNNTNSGRYPSYTGTLAQCFYIWGAQLTIGSELLPYYDNGQWETLTYTTATFSNDGVAEFYVDCDGTTGWINVDDWSVDTSVDSRGQDYWGVNATYTEPDFKRGTTSYTFVK